MAFIKWLLSYPMHCVEKCRFVDVVSGKSIGLYLDRNERLWLAEHRWAFFRVEA